MPFDFQRFCRDHRIDIAPARHKHRRAGWLNIKCPFHTGDPSGFHLGFNLQQNFFVCWSCGWHSVQQVIEAVTGLRGQNVKGILQLYHIGEAEQPDLQVVRPAKIEMPEGCGAMTDRHKKYLVSRQFDPDELEAKWQLKGTTHLGSDRWRIVATISFLREIISYQGRDIIGNQVKYKACPAELEIIPHKHVLYGWDELPDNLQSAVIVEGITGVWRLGFGALGTFGSKFSASQIRLLTQRFERLWLFFDPDEAGRIAADKMSTELMGLGKEVYLLEVPKGTDSGNLPQDEANNLMKEILG